MSRVKWNAKHEYEYVHNFKLVQAAFAKHGIEKWLDVDKLIKGRPLDNIEIFQWFHRFFQIRDGPAMAVGYNGLARRQLSGGPLCDFAQGGYKGKGPAPTAAAPAAGTTKARTTPPAVKAGVAAGAARKQAPARVPAAVDATIEQLRTENEQLRTDLEAQVQWAEDVEKERVFYFEKLRKLELLVQEGATALDAETVKAILYAPFDENAAPAEAQEEEVDVPADDGEDMTA